MSRQQQNCSHVHLKVTLFEKTATDYTLNGTTLANIEGDNEDDPDWLPEIELTCLDCHLHLDCPDWRQLPEPFQSRVALLRDGRGIEYKPAFSVSIDINID